MPLPRRPLENLPLSPANFNVPQSTNVIYYKTPAGSIYKPDFQPVETEHILFRNVKREAVGPVVSPTKN